MVPRHRLLERQVGKHLKRIEKLEPELGEFLEAVNSAYFQSDDDRALMERSLELSSQELMQANAELRAVFRAFPDVVYLWVDPRGEIVQHSEGAERIAPLAGERLLRSSLYEVLEPGLAGQFREMVDKVLAGAVQGGLEFSQGQGTEEAYYEVRAAQVVRGQIILIIRDVTERKQAEQALQEVLEGLERLVEERTAKLRESEETFRKISAHAHDGIIMLDNAGQVSFWNQAAETIFGYRTEDMEGLGLEAIFTDPEDWRLHREGYGSFQATGEGQVVGRTVELKARRKGGEIFDVELSVSALRIKDQWCALGIVRDVTLRKQSREALREAKEAAEAANKLKSEFLSMVSHELRTPLTSVVGFAKVIKKRLEETLIPALNLATDKQQRHLGQVESNIAVIISEGERLTELINNVLDLAKLEAGHFEWRMEQVDVTDVVFRSLEATRILFKRKGLTVEERVSQDLPRVRGDLDRLMQVLINLLANAAKFTEQGRVVCRAEVKDGTVVLSVEDTGVGMEPHELEHIFDKFTQIGDTLTDKPRGTGLGLPISKEIVEHHGGSMWVKSRPGQGSVFSFSIPA